MRPRVELGLALGLFLLLGAFIIVDAWTKGGGETLDQRRTTYRPTPLGSRAWTDALTRLGVAVDRSRRPLPSLDTTLDREAILAVLDPSFPLDILDAKAIRDRIAHGGSVLLAGQGTSVGMNCLGWSINAYRAVPAKVFGQVGGTSIAVDSVLGTLRVSTDPFALDSARRGDLGIFGCAPPSFRSVDTLLATASGRPVMLMLRTAEGGRAILIADGLLFSDQMLRRTDAGPLALSLIVPAYRRVVVDEYHHGYATDGSMGRALLGWSLGSPWGRALWQVTLVGVVMLLAATVRGGPVFQARSRQRRSPLEQVRALAQALAAARGHDVAVRLLVGGLRRRLSADGRPTRDDPTRWLADLTERMRTPRGRAAARALQESTRPGQSASGVLTAANAVEDVWDETRP
jgi:hypothetical protein